VLPVLTISNIASAKPILVAISTDPPRDSILTGIALSSKKSIRIFE